jgi:hypothetical protein
MIPQVPGTDTPFRWVRIALGALAAAAALPGAGAEAPQCHATSGPATALLVELYTSGHCSGCREAERWLAGMAERPWREQVVPITLHVDYLDYVGSSDPKAARQTSQRQRRLSLLQRMALVYTPHVVVQGRDVADWSRAGFDPAALRTNAQPAKARISLRLSGGEDGFFDVEAEAEVSAPADGQEPVLYLAAYQNRLDGPAPLPEYAVLKWEGPLPFGRAHRLQERRSVPLLPKARASDSGVAAFVQDRRTGEVLQALMLPACSG